MASSGGNNEIPAPMTVHDSQIPFHDLVIPASMRSKYWRFFGFPGDESKNIISREKIVCAICRRQIAYNKNTTNLSTHLIARHMDIMREYFPEDISQATAKVRKAKQFPRPRTLNKRVKLEKPDGDQWNDTAYTQQPMKQTQKLLKQCDVKAEPTNNESIRVLVTTEDGEEFIESLDYEMFEVESHSMTGYEDATVHENEDDFLNEEYLVTNAVAETDSSTKADAVHDDSVSDNNKRTSIDVQRDKSYRRLVKRAIGEVNIAPSKSATDEAEASNRNNIGEVEVTDAIKNFIVSDILSPAMVDGNGFRTLLTTVSGQVDIALPDSAKVRRPSLSICSSSIDSF